jgi:hypothetical protein
MFSVSHEESSEFEAVIKVGMNLLGGIPAMSNPLFSDFIAINVETLKMLSKVGAHDRWIIRLELWIT